MKPAVPNTYAVPAPNPAPVTKLMISALCALFFLFGMYFATWASRIPAIRDAISLTPGTLGLVLLLRGLGSVLIMPLVAIVISLLGARKAVILAGAFVLIFIPPMALATGWKSLAAVLFVAGASASCFDMAINSIGAGLEKRAKRSIMSTFHAWYCVGNFGGALIGTVAASYKVDVFLHFGVITILLAVILAVSYRYLPKGTKVEETQPVKFSIPHGGLIWLGIIGFFGSVTENSISNWVALFYSDHILVSDGLSPIGYTAFAAAMLIARLAGDRLKDVFGGSVLLTAGGVLTSIGLISAILFPNIYVATIGFFAAGMGTALIFPLLFSAAGKEGTMALTSVATLGYAGGIIAPVIMGYVVTEWQLSGGMIFVSGITFLIAIIASRARLLKQ